MDGQDLRESVRERYAEAAASATSGSVACCDSSCCGGQEGAFGAALYEPADRQGETVLDLGSGGGIDVLLSAKRVGPAGKVYGLDLTEEMLALALKNKRKAGADNVEFLKGYVEDIPLPASTVDVVISNCVINLSADKQRVFREMFRVLRRGGRLGVSDVVASNELTPGQRAERGSFVGCIAGALSFAEYEEGLRRSGFEDITVTPTHEVADGMFGAIVRATKPI